MEDILCAAATRTVPTGRMRKGMYILPSLFTTANIAAGFFAIIETVRGECGGPRHLDYAAMAIGFAVFFDGLDGRIARLTHTESDFGKGLDSLADVVAFGVAPALLAWMWGFHLLPSTMPAELHLKVIQLGTILALLSSSRAASRLARFNITTNPQPSNPGRPGKKYFVGMPIPAGAGVIAAVVHFLGGEPLISWRASVSWLLMVVVVGYLMVSTWRFYSFKDIDFRSRRPFRLIVILAVIGASIWFFSGPALFPDCDLLYGFRHPLAPAMDLPPQSAACTAASPGGISYTMTPISKSAISHADLRGTNLFRVAIVGAASLMEKKSPKLCATGIFLPPIFACSRRRIARPTGGSRRRNDFHPEHSPRTVRERRFHFFRLRSALHAR